MGLNRDIKLTATKAMGELDIETPAPIAERKILAGGWYGIPGLETAVSVHIEAEEVAIANGSRKTGGDKREI